MTDRIKGYVVTLERDIRADDAHAITQAIQMIKGVASVEPLVSNLGDHMARIQVCSEIEQKLYAAIRSIFRPERTP